MYSSTSHGASEVVVRGHLSEKSLLFSHHVDLQVWHGSLALRPCHLPHPVIVFSEESLADQDIESESQFLTQVFDQRWHLVRTW